MPRLDASTRNIAIGRIQAGESQYAVARDYNVHRSMISRLWQRYQQNGTTDDHPRSGRPRVTTAAQDRYTRLLHLRNRTVAATVTPNRILDYVEFPHRLFKIDYVNMDCVSDDRTLEPF